MSPSSDELRELLIRTRRGDEESARRLYAHAHPTLVGCARIILRDEDLARDAAHAVFAKILTVRLRTVKKISLPMPWLVTMVRNEARDMLKSRVRAENRSHFAHKPSHPIPRTDFEIIRRCVSNLPDELAEIIVLKHVAEMTFDEIGLALSISRNTAADRHRRALQKLRQSLERTDIRTSLEPTDA